MRETVGYSDLDDALRRCGATWNAAQSHGLLCGRLTLRGNAAAEEWLALVLDAGDPGNAACGESAGLLETLFENTRRQLAERQSQFMPLLPDDATPSIARADALAHWCEGYLHGLVSGDHGDDLRARLAGEPIADIIRDMLEITRATADPDAGDDSDEAAYAELVEYIRVATQLAYEELAEFRPAAGTNVSNGWSN